MKVTVCGIRTAKRRGHWIASVRHIASCWVGLHSRIILLRCRGRAFDVFFLTLSSTPSFIFVFLAYWENMRLFATCTNDLLRGVEIESNFFASFSAKPLGALPRWKLRGRPGQLSSLTWPANSFFVVRLTYLVFYSSAQQCRNWFSREVSASSAWPGDILCPEWDPSSDISGILVINRCMLLSSLLCWFQIMEVLSVAATALSCIINLKKICNHPQLLVRVLF